MDKVGALAAAGIGGGSIAIGGVYWTGAFARESKEKEGEVIDVELPKTIDEFKSESNENVEGCVKWLFPNMKNMGEGGAAYIDDGKVEKDFFGSSKAEEMKGCLVVNWDKEESKDSGKWKGTFRLLWSVKQGNKGFIVFAAAKNENNKQLRWDGLVYELSQENTTNTWSKSKKLITENKTQNKNGVKDRFPQAGSALEEVKSDTFWRFIKNENDMEQVCGANDCNNLTNKKESSFKKYWTLEGSSHTSSAKLDGWTTKLSEWWKEIFGEDKLNMKEVVKDKTVKWTERKMEKIEKVKEKM